MKGFLRISPKSGVRTGGRFLLAAAFGLLAGVTAARAQTCNLPEIAICDGCARKVMITVKPNGTCTVAIETGPATGAGQPRIRIGAGTDLTGAPVEAAPRGETRLSIGVRVERPAPRVVTRVLRASPSPRPVRPLSEQRCFYYNGQQFCE